VLSLLLQYICARILTVGKFILSHVRTKLKVGEKITTKEKQQQQQNEKRRAQKIPRKRLERPTLYDP